MDRENVRKYQTGSHFDSWRNGNSRQGDVHEGSHVLQSIYVMSGINVLKFKTVMHSLWQVHGKFQTDLYESSHSVNRAPWNFQAVPYWVATWPFQSRRYVGAMNLWWDDVCEQHLENSRQMSLWDVHAVARERLDDVMEGWWTVGDMTSLLNAMVVAMEWQFICICLWCFGISKSFYIELLC